MWFLNENGEKICLNLPEHKIGEPPSGTLPKFAGGLIILLSILDISLIVCLLISKYN